MFNQQPHQALRVEDEFIPGRVLVPVKGGHQCEIRAESLLHPADANVAPEEGWHEQRTVHGNLNALREETQLMSLDVSGLAEDLGCCLEGTTWSRNMFSSP